MESLLKIDELHIHFQTDGGTVKAVDGISLDVQRGETIGIVGESGSGKSVTALAIMRLLRERTTRISGGGIFFKTKNHNTQNLLELPEKDLQKLRGSEISMIFQEPMSSLNPVFRCGHQVTEAIQQHQKVGFSVAREQTLYWFERVKLPDPVRIFDAFPHQISGGQKQRVMIAMAMCCHPQMLIADEPTTALDVTVQKSILDLMRDLRFEHQMSMLFISHDLGVIADIADRVAVMFRGKIVEQGTVAQIFEQPQHPYTRGLVACRPSISKKLYRLPTVNDFLANANFQSKIIDKTETNQRKTELENQDKQLIVKDLEVKFPIKKNWLGQPLEWLKAVDGVSFEVRKGESFGIAGESGCGKTTLGRAIARLNEPHSGQIFFENKSLLTLSDTEMRPLRRKIQVIFQDPYAALNPRMTIGSALAEPLMVHKMLPTASQCRDRCVDLLETVGLTAQHLDRYPHEFSGGQRQRICIARALTMQPALLICDEIVSALDVSVQATVLNLLADLQAKLGLTYLFISHDLGVIHQFCDRLMVMQQGKIEEIGYPDKLLHHPKSAYTRRLVEAVL